MDCYALTIAILWLLLHTVRSIDLGSPSLLFFEEESNIVPLG